MNELSGQLTHVEPALVPLWLIPLIPLLGAALNAFFGRRIERSSFGRALAKKLRTGSFGVTLVAVAAVASSFALVVAEVFRLVSLGEGHRYLYSFAWPLLHIGTVEASFAFAMDPLAAVMALVITGVGALIHVYAASYMAKDRGYPRFFACMNLFVAAMLLLVLGDGFLTMFIGWEGVGLASFLLIGFWFDDPAKAKAGVKAFVVNRIGDAGLLVGICVLFWGLGGQWMDGGWFANAEARFVAIHAREPGEAAPKASDEAKAKAQSAAADDDDDEAEARARELRKKAALAGGKGYLTITAYPGARVYFGIYDGAQLEAPLPPPLFGISPLVHVEAPVGLTSIAIVPPGGVTVGGGYEAALLRDVAIDPGKETVVTTQGGTLTFREIEAQLAAEDATGKPVMRDAIAHATIGGVSVVTLACLLFLLAAAGKSAQIPLYVWLPDAMAGPTPVSALIHAATMVTAGVYLIARLSFLFALSPAACAVVAAIGAATALYAASMALYQYDLKKVLAYSTVSQLGFMFLGVGVGAYEAGVFHVVTHAFFKGCLFLAAGAVIHGMHAVHADEGAAQDLRKMGGLAKVMPRTARAYRAACLAIAAAPIPFFAGFWSKDEILWRALSTENTGALPGVALWAAGIAAAGLTSFYIWRSYYLAFEGEPASDAIAKKVHEAPSTMILVVEVLALLSVVGGAVLGFAPRLVGGDDPSILARFLGPVFAHADVSFSDHGLTGEIGSMIISVGIAAWAWSLAKKRYGAGRKKTWAADEQKLPLFALASKGYGVDALYERVFVRGALALRWLAADIDRWIVDAVVDGTAVAARAIAATTGLVDAKVVDGAVDGVANGTLAAGGRLRRLQTGRIQTYVYGLLVGVAVLALLHYLLR